MVSGVVAKGDTIYLTMQCWLLLAMTMMIAAVTAAEYRNRKFYRFQDVHNTQGQSSGDWGDSSKLRGAVTCATDKHCYGFNAGPTGVETVALDDRAGPYRDDDGWMYYKTGKMM